MNDFDKLQGLWSIESSTWEGGEVDECATHYLIRGNTLTELVPDMVDDGRLRTSFVLDETQTPKRLILKLDYNGPDGPPDPNPRIVRYIYCLEDHILTLCWHDDEGFPDDFSDSCSIMTLARDFGPIPEGSQPTNTPPLVDEVLGTLRWDDNFSWYEGSLQVAGTSFKLRLCVETDGSTSPVLVRARQIVSDFERYRRLVADYAVRELLSVKNASWLQAGEAAVDAQQFKAKLGLDAICIETDGEATFWHNDGELFWGHSVQVCIDAKDRCKLVDIPG